jgi:hypothetical protein
MIDDTIIEQIRQKNPLLEYCQSLGWRFKKTGEEHYAPCPFHQDGKRGNLRVNEEKQFWFCDVCNFGGDVIQLVRRLDNSNFNIAARKLAKRGGVPLENHGTETSRQKKRANSSNRGDIVATYDYTDENGKLLFQTVRYKPKDFQQRQPDGKGGWHWNLKDVRRVLYRLPEVLKAEEIWQVEGEKDADNLRSVGFTATTNPHGAGKWRPEYAETFRGKRVLVVPDNDDADNKFAGQRHADAVARSLHGVAANVKVVALPDAVNGQKVKDVSDFLAAVGDNTIASEQLRQLAENTETFNPNPAPPRILKILPPCVAVTFAEWRQAIKANFPALVRPSEICLSVVAQLLLNDVTNPFALALVDVPSSGKTIALNFFDTPELTYSTDSFTPAAFVSHASNVKREELSKVDMLPRIRYRTLIVRDLAPIFGAKEDDLIKSLGILTRALDGEGLETDSGVHGKRGYKGDFLFTLLAGTTPIPPRVFKIMGNLGSRLFFLSLQPPDKDHEELASQNRGRSRKAKEILCQKVTDAFLRGLWSANPTGIDWNREANPEDCLLIIARCAKLLASLRGAINVWYSEASGPEKLSHNVPVIEQPDRINCLLYNLARGHAVVCGRHQLTRDDLWPVLEVTFDSAPTIRAKLFRALIETGGVLKTSHVTKLLRCSPPTARKEMECLAVLNVVDKTGEEEPEDDLSETEIVLTSRFMWFIGDECRALRCGSTSTQGENLFSNTDEEPLKEFPPSAPAGDGQAVPVTTVSTKESDNGTSYTEL